MKQSELATGLMKRGEGPSTLGACGQLGDEETTHTELITKVIKCGGVPSNLQAREETDMSKWKVESENINC